MIGDFNNGMSGFLDWNVLLDERGGMNHVDNFCGAPLIYDHNEKKLLRQSSYCFIRHMSAYVPAGSRVVAHSCYRGDISVATFLTPDENSSPWRSTSRKKTCRLCSTMCRITPWRRLRYRANPSPR